MKLVLLIESHIDFPVPTLSKTVWDLSENPDKPKLKAENKEKIIALIKQYPKFDLMESLKEAHIIGSICSNQYVSSTDVDIHLIVDNKKLDELVAEGKYEATEDIVKDVMYYSRHVSPPNDAMIGTHVMELYVQRNPQQDLVSDGSYDILNDTWNYGPRIEKYDFDPYEYYTHLFSTIKKISTEFDVELGELRRDAIDHTFITKALENIKPEVKPQLLKKLKAKLAEIENDVLKLMALKKKVVDVRHNSVKTSREDAKYNDMNATFKFLDRYQFLSIIRQLERFHDDKKISADEVPKISDIL